MAPTRLSALLFASFTLSAAGASAQTVAGRIIDADTGAPIEGAPVVLLDDAETRVAGAFSDAGGRFRVRAPAPGRYRLEARLIGYEAVRTAWIEAGAGETVERVLRARVRPIGLEGITARAKPRCRPRPGATSDGARLWKEANAALLAVSVTQSAARVVFTARRYERDVALGEEWEPGESVDTARSSGRPPFHSVPVERMLEDGFVREVADTIIYYAPDARALLSDAFLSTHCFWAVPGGDGLVGLAFEPVPARRDVAEIDGTLWLDRASGKLRTLEYRYTRLPGGAVADDFGGALEFDRLENGAWIVRRWMIRMPIVARSAGRMDHRVVGIREAGGEVLSVDRAGGRPVVASRTGVFEGRLVSATGAPIADALVYLSGTQHADTTAPDGRFRFEEVEEGGYALAWHHAGLASAAGEPVAVEVRAGETATRRIQVAGVDAPLAGDRARPEATTVVAGAPARILGTVVDGIEGGPVVGATVRVDSDSGRVRVTDERGRFFVERVPPGRRGLEVVHAAFEPVNTGVAVTPDALVRVEVRLGPVELEGLRVEATARRGPLADVYWRVERGFAGQFITRDEIRRRFVRTAADLLRGNPEVQVRPRGGDRLGSIVMPPTGCVPDVYLDGMRVTRRDPGGDRGGAAGELHRRFSGVPSPSPATEAYDAVNLAAPATVEVIEIYADAEPIPGAFGSSVGACGVIAVWTRRG